MLSVFELALCLALVAVTWAVVLVDTGMLLQPVQRWLREKHKNFWVHCIDPNPNDYDRGYIEQAYYGSGKDLDSRWWWKPLWGCYKCVAGQLGLWGYIVAVWPAYNFWLHLLAICATIFLACVLNKFYQWSQTN